MLENDIDVVHLALVSKYTAAAILPGWSGVWRDRFLAQYDYPIISDSLEFRPAYQVRQLILKAFVSFDKGGGPQGIECLDTIREMIMGTWSTDFA